VNALLPVFDKDEIPPNDVFVWVKLFESLVAVMLLLLPNTDGDVAPLKAEKGDDLLLLVVPPNTDAVFTECSPRGVVKGVTDDRGGVALVLAARLPKVAPFELLLPKAVPKEEEFDVAFPELMPLPKALNPPVPALALARPPNVPFELVLPKAVPKEAEFFVSFPELIPLPKALNPPAPALALARPPKVSFELVLPRAVPKEAEFVVSFPELIPLPKALNPPADELMALAKAPNLSNPPEVATDEAIADPSVPKADEFVLGLA